jgi:hypothetical protein
MRGLVGLALGAVALAACTTGSAGTSQQTSPTSLTVTFWSDGAKVSSRRQWTLRCAPPRGTLARPAVACRKLATGGTKLFAPTPKNVACTQIYGGPQVALVRGTFRGKRVWTWFRRRDGCEIARWKRVDFLFPSSGAQRLRS